MLMIAVPAVKGPANVPIGGVQDTHFISVGLGESPIDARLPLGIESIRDA